MTLIYIKKYGKKFRISQLSWAQARAKGITKKRWQRAKKISESLKRYWRIRKKAKLLKRKIEGKPIPGYYRWTIGINYVVHSNYYSLTVRVFFKTAEEMNEYIRKNRERIIEKMEEYLENKLKYNKIEWWFDAEPNEETRFVVMNPDEMKRIRLKKEYWTDELVFAKKYRNIKSGWAKIQNIKNLSEF